MPLIKCPLASQCVKQLRQEELLSAFEHCPVSHDTLGSPCNMRLYVKYSLFLLAYCSPAAEVFRGLTAAGQARGASVHYGACLHPGPAPGRVMSGFEVAELAPLSKGSASASVSRAGPWNTPHFVVAFRSLLHACVNGVSLPHIGTQNDRQERWIISFESSRSASPSRNQTREYTVAVRQQRYNGNRAPSSRLRPRHGGVCVWLVHSNRRWNLDKIFMFSAKNQTRIVRPALPGMRTIRTAAVAKKKCNPCVSLERLCCPYSTCDAPGTSSRPHAQREPYF